MGKTASHSFKLIACIAAISVVSSGLAGCLLIPEAAPLLGHEWKKRVLFDVIRGVQCEIRWAVRNQIERDRDHEYGKRKLTWFENWNALIDLNLQVEDSLAFNPGVSLKTPNWVDAQVGLGDYTKPRVVPQFYNFGVGGGLSYNASREDIVQFAYPFSQFVNDPEPIALTPESCYKIGGIAINANLKINDWLDDVLEPIKKCAFLGMPAREDETMIPLLSGEPPLSRECRDLDFAQYQAGDPIKTINHKITFKLSFNMNATPNWSLVRVATTSAKLFDATRKDTSELLITFGPPAGGARSAPARGAAARSVVRRTVKPGVALSQYNDISVEMLLTHNALQIGSAVRDALQQ
ncbi:hypothetical protein V3H18_06125 [Methylocystis sp. 9N]|uniref:Uncharacterized protein n=1 Tax=Methylocystis borbori TaxID=3118750 RepID=A0ABU7XFE7_9HYPH